MTLLDRAVKFLLPREAGFFDLLERGAACARDSGAAMLALCEAKAGSDREEKLKVLRDIEHAADAVIHETYDALNRTFVTPLDRSDIYALSTQLEEIVDLNHATAMQLIVHAMEDVPEGSIPLARLIAESTREVAEAVVLLRTLRRLDEVQQHTRHMSKLEHDGDEIFRNRVGELFRTQKNAVQLIQHKEFLEGLERTLDACDHVGTALKTIVIKNA
ncbi:MAG: DUF47 family protein [Deltaproteobacteria bacterium]|nr:DUF47 family protein [Deltaproteobacteria bacterium]